MRAVTLVMHHIMPDGTVQDVANMYHNCGQVDGKIYVTGNISLSRR